MSRENPRIAVLGFAIECNRFSPVSTAHDFEVDVDIRGNRIVTEGRAANAITMPDLPGFFTEMDGSGPWTPVPIRVSQAQPGGPVEEQFFKAFLAEIAAGLKASRPVDGVFVSCHGAALAEGTDDPDGDLFELIRSIVGPDVPVVSTFDLHANVSRRMTDNLSVFVGYRENPHVDIRERGIEAAKCLRECLAGLRAALDRGATSFTIPAERASSALSAPPFSISSNAFDRPTRRARNQEPPQSGDAPSLS